MRKNGKKIRLTGRVANLLANQLGALAVPPHGSCRRDHSFDFRASACDEH